MQQMLEISKGSRAVPFIVMQNGDIVSGFGGT